MPLQKISRQDVLALQGVRRGRGANQEYVQFLRSSAEKVIFEIRDSPLARRSRRAMDITD